MIVRYICTIDDILEFVLEFKPLAVCLHKQDELNRTVLRTVKEGSQCRKKKLCSDESVSIMRKMFHPHLKNEGKDRNGS